jgi:hypothetical protein
MKIACPDCGIEFDVVTALQCELRRVHVVLQEFEKELGDADEAVGEVQDIAEAAKDYVGDHYTPPDETAAKRVHWSRIDI